MHDVQHVYFLATYDKVQSHLWIFQKMPAKAFFVAVIKCNTAKISVVSSGLALSL